MRPPLNTIHTFYVLSGPDDVETSVVREKFEKLLYEECKGKTKNSPRVAYQGKVIFSDVKETQTESEEVITLFKIVSGESRLYNSASSSTIIQTTSYSSSNYLLTPTSSEPSLTSDYFIENTNLLYRNSYYNNTESKTKNRKQRCIQHKHHHQFTFANLINLMKCLTNLDPTNQNVKTTEEEIPYYLNVLKAESRKELEKGYTRIATKLSQYWSSTPLNRRRFMKDNLKFMKGNLQIKVDTNRERKQCSAASTQTNNSYIRMRKLKLEEKKIKEKGRLYLQSLKNNGIISSSCC